MMERGPDGDAQDPTQDDAAEMGMAELLDSPARGYANLRRGDVVDGVVVRVDRDEVLVDIGVKSEAIVPANETGAPHGDPTRSLKVGDEVVAYVLQPEDVEGHVILSLTRAQPERLRRVRRPRRRRRPYPPLRAVVGPGDAPEPGAQGRRRGRRLRGRGGP